MPMLASPPDPSSHAGTSVAEWAAAGDTIRSRGQPIFVRKSGPPGAEALLLIHGFPTASWDWAALWPVLSQHFHVYTLDLIGFGLSAKPKRYEYSLFDQADLCETYLAQEGVRAYHVLAHDYGDTVAQELLARRQEPGERPKLMSVAMLNGGLFPETIRPALIQRLLLSPLGPLVSRMTSRARLARTMRRIFGPGSQPGDDVIEAFWSLITAGNGRAIMHRLIRYMLERRQHRQRWVGALQDTDVPLKLIAGAVDPISGTHMIERFRELVPEPDLTVLDGIGHYPQIEAPTDVASAYLAFRARIDAF